MTHHEHVEGVSFQLLHAIPLLQEEGKQNYRHATWYLVKMKQACTNPAAKLMIVGITDDIGLSNHLVALNCHGQGVIGAGDFWLVAFHGIFTTYNNEGMFFRLYKTVYLFILSP